MRDIDTLGENLYHEFSGTPIPIPEMDAFYSIPNPRMPQNDRPYTWLMFVMSADGVGSLKEATYPDSAIGLSGPGIALKQFLDIRSEAVGARADWRLLQYGWAVADAVVAGSGVLRAEPDLTWMPTDQDLLEEFRLRHAGNVPLRVIITGKGFAEDEVSRFRVFTDQSGDFHTLIATSEQGYRLMQGVFPEGRRGNVEVRPFGTDGVDFRLLGDTLRREYGVERLDLQGGPDIAGQFFAENLVDEYRLTLSPAVAGGLSTEGAVRPGPVKTDFAPQHLRTMSIIRLGIFGNHTFYRYRVAQHENE